MGKAFSYVEFFLASESSTYQWLCFYSKADEHFALWNTLLPTRFYSSTHFAPWNTFNTNYKESS